jgi:hypothetical protein
MAYGTFALPSGIRRMRNPASAAIVGFLMNQTMILLREFQSDAVRANVSPRRTSGRAGPLGEVHA